MNHRGKKDNVDRRPTAILLLIILFQVVPLLAQSGSASKSLASEKKVVIPRESGYEVIQWTQTGKNNHLYFNIESFIDKDHFLFYSDRSGVMNLFEMNMLNGSMTQLTDEKDLTQSSWHWPQFHTLWYMTDTELKTLNTTSREIRTLYKFERGHPVSFAITPDGRYCVYGANKNPGFSANHSTGPYALFRLDLKTREVKQISPDLGFKIGHVQASPADPTRVTYCWQHIYVEGAPGMLGNTPNRIWWNNIEGTDGGPVGIQEFGLHRTHEFWFPDGSHLGYSARYQFGPDKGKQFIGIITPDGRENFMMEVPVSSSHNQMFSDNKHWVSDLYDGLNLVLFTIEGRQIVKKEILYNHNSTMVGQPSHPHPHFSPDGRYILFATDKTGSPQIYTVTVDIGR